MVPNWTWFSKTSNVKCWMVVKGVGDAWISTSRKASRLKSLLLWPVWRETRTLDYYDLLCIDVKMTWTIRVRTLASMYSIRRSNAVSFSLSVASRDRHDMSGTTLQHMRCYGRLRNLRALSSDSKLPQHWREQYSITPRQASQYIIITIN